MRLCGKDLRHCRRRKMVRPSLFSLSLFFSPKTTRELVAARVFNGALKK